MSRVIKKQSASGWTAWAKFLCALFVVGAVLGVISGLAADPADTEFITGSWSYRPKAHWYLHALMFGLFFAALGGALWIALALVRRFGVFLPGAVVMTVLGVTAVVLGVIGVGEMAIGQRVMFAVGGVVFVGIGVACWRFDQGLRSHSLGRETS